MDKPKISNERMEGTIRDIIVLRQGFGCSVTKTIRDISERFNISLKAAAGYVDKYWKDTDGKTH